MSCIRSFRRGRLFGHRVLNQLIDPLLDEEALLTTLAYVDLNVMAAGMAKTPEESAHTSVKARVEHCREMGLLEGLVATKAGSRASAQAPSSGLSATFSPYKQRCEAF